MDKLLKAIEAISPFLTSYPIWVRGTFSLWLVLGTALLIMFLFVPRDKSKAGGSDNRLQLEVLPEVETADWAHRETERPILVALARQFSDATVAKPDEESPAPRVILIETAPFESSHSAFKFSAASDFSILTAGEAFLERDSGELVQLSKRRVGRGLEFGTARADASDRLVLILRIESEQSITQELLPSVVRLALLKS